MDVQSLYTNIRNSEGMETTKRAQTNKQNCTHKSRHSIFATYIYPIKLIFNCKSYFPNQGYVMGSTASYSNIFIAEFERKYTYPLINNMSMP